jgi:hypothetical protein
VRRGSERGGVGTGGVNMVSIDMGQVKAEELDSALVRGTGVIGQ